MRLRFWLAAMLAVLVGVAGVQGIAHATAVRGGTDPAPQKTVPYTSAEYFDGIYFGVGPVAKLVPQLHPDRDPKEIKEREALAADVRKVINSEDRKFLPEFADAVQSGKHVLTRKALVAGADALMHAYQVLEIEIPLPPNPSPYCDGFKAPTTLTCGGALATTKDLAVALAQWQHVGAAVAIPIYLWVVVHEYLWITSDNNEKDNGTTDGSGNGLPEWTGDLDLYLDEITLIVVKGLGTGPLR